jgi:hypothetical protein
MMNRPIILADDFACGAGIMRQDAELGNVGGMAAVDFEVVDGVAARALGLAAESRGAVVRGYGFAEL